MLYGGYRQRSFATISTEPFDQPSCLLQCFTDGLLDSEIPRVGSEPFHRGSNSGFILGEDDPAPFANFDEPTLVFRIRGKVIVVNLDGFADLPARLSNDRPTEGTVNKKD